MKRTFFSDDHPRISTIYNKLLGGFYFLCFLLGLNLCFSPIGTINKSISIGSSIYVIKELFTKEYESSRYLKPSFTIIAFITIVITLMMLIYIIKHLLSNTLKIEHFLSRLITNAILFILIVGITYLISAPLSAYYGCTINNIYMLYCLFFLPHIISEILILLFYRKQRTEVKRRIQEERLALRAKYHLIKRKDTALEKAQKAIWSIALISIFILCIFALPVYMFIEEGPTSLIGTLANCDIHKYYDVKVGTKMMFSPEEDSDLILTVQNSLVGEIYKTSFPREQDKWEEYGYNYLYYKEKARELKREMGELWPEESSSPEKSMEKYLKKLDELEKCVKFLSENVETLPYNYAVIEFGPLEEKIIYTGGDFHLGQDRRWEYYKEITSYTHNRNVNYCDENGKKWGYSDGSLSSLILGEKIELSVSTFSLDTNFKTEKIIATVYYSDGSTKSSIITPSNYEELNLAPSGKHTLRWSDELGDYEFMITKE